MRRAFIVPGWKATANSSWFKWLAKKLREHGIETTVLGLPLRYTPVLRVWIKHISDAVGVPDSQTILVGHSTGAVAILRYLEELPPGMGVDGCVLVSGFPHALIHRSIPHVLTRRPRPENIRGKCRWILAVHSNNDWRVPLSNADWLVKELGAKLIVLERAGHITTKDGYPELPLDVLQAILDLAPAEPGP